MYRDPHVRLLLVKVSLHRFLRLEKRDRTKKYELVEGEKHAIRTIVHEFYVTEKKMPTIDGIMKRLHDITSPLIMVDQAQDNRQVLMEEHDIRFKRIQYLK
jgi:hypothetical protein